MPFFARLLSCTQASKGSSPAPVRKGGGSAPPLRKAGGSTDIAFQNVFDSQKEFKYVCDNPAFTCKDSESIAAKKDVKISVAYKPEPPEDGQEPEPVTHASLYVQIVGSKLSAWRFYLEGHQE